MLEKKPLSRVNAFLWPDEILSENQSKSIQEHKATFNPLFTAWFCSCNDYRLRGSTAVTVKHSELALLSFGDGKTGFFKIKVVLIF